MEQFVPVELDDVLVASQINNVRFSSLRSQSVRISLGTTAPSETCDKKIASILLRLCEIIVGSRLSWSIICHSKSVTSGLRHGNSNSNKYSCK